MSRPAAYRASQAPPLGAKGDLPEGRTRLAAAVLDKLVASAARQAHGVSDIETLAVGAAAGAVAGAAVGLLGGGAAGAVIGAGVGSAVGAATGTAVSHLTSAGKETELGGPAVSVQIGVTSTYGEDLHEVTAKLRRRIEQVLGSLGGVQVARIDVTFTDLNT